MHEQKNSKKMRIFWAFCLITLSHFTDMWPTEMFIQISERWFNNRIMGQNVLKVLICASCIASILNPTVLQAFEIKRGMISIPIPPPLHIRLKPTLITGKSGINPIPNIPILPIDRNFCMQKLMAPLWSLVVVVEND